MKKLVIGLGISLLSGVALCSGGAKWDYVGDLGPDKWAQLSPEYSACDGSNQSPINLTGFINADLEPIEFYYDAGSEEILNNGHTVQVNSQPGSSIVIDDIQFELKQFHFHVPSENRIHGQWFPMEMHLVHADSNGNLAVIAVMVTEGPESEALAKAWAQMPRKGERQILTADISPLEILPSDREYYRFNGSLTTPPCSEGVRWLVMKHPISASQAQFDQFVDTIHHPNNRPVQPVNARPVLQ